MGKNKNRRRRARSQYCPGRLDNLLGVVLNKVDLKARNRYEGHGKYYYSRHFAHYGYTD